LYAKDAGAADRMAADVLGLAAKIAAPRMAG